MKRNILITSAYFDCGRSNYVFDMDSQKFLPMYGFNEITISNSLQILTTKKLPSEIGYKIIHFLMLSFLVESDFESAFLLIAVNKYYLREFYKFYFGTTGATLIVMYRRLSKVFNQLAAIHDLLLCRTTEEEFTCLEMELEAEHVMYFEPWHFTTPSFSFCPDPTLDEFSFTKLVRMESMKINTVMMANKHYHHSFSTNGALKPDVVKHPFIVFAFTFNHHNILPSVGMMTQCRRWQGFMNLLTLGYGPNCGVYYTTQTPSEESFILKEFPVRPLP